MRLITVEEMKHLEDTANDGGYSYAEMMKNAGLGMANFIHNRYSSTSTNTILGLVGGGKNGGDTIIALTELSRKGWLASAVLMADGKQEDSLLSDFSASGGKIIEVSALKTITCEDASATILLDGIFGTGFRLPLPPNIVSVLKIVEEKWDLSNRIAVDCPSGVDCVNGNVSPGTLKVNLTLCLDAVKTGLLKFPAFEYCGELMVIDLKLQKFSRKQKYESSQIIDKQFLLKNLPIRSDYSHKGSFGKVLIIGGSINFTGAPVFVGRGAYAVGAGLVQAAVPERLHTSLAGANPEITWLLLEDAGGVIADNAIETVTSHVSGFDCLVIGPGIGRVETTKRFVQRLLFGADISERSSGAGFLGVEEKKTIKVNTQFPIVVIDADALILMARQKDWYEKMKLRTVLTPHPGEMAVMTGLTVDEIQQNREQVASDFAKKWHQTVILKGALTVIADGTGQIAVIPFASSSLAKAGSGDILAGMVGGLIAQGVLPFPAAACGAWMHAVAGIEAGKILGANESVLASDVICSIPIVYRQLRK